MWLRSIDSVFAFVILGMIWLIFRKRTSSQFGYALFLLALVKLVVPAQISILGVLSQKFSGITIDQSIADHGIIYWDIFKSTATTDSILDVPNSNYPFTIYFALMLFGLWAAVALSLLIRQIRQEWKMRQLYRSTSPAGE